MQWSFEKAAVDELSLLIQNPDYNEEVVDLIHYLENYKGFSKDIVTVKSLDEILVLKRKYIRAVEVDGDYLVIYYQERHIRTRQRLYQFKEKCEDANLVQVSKQSVINIRHLERMEASFSGNMTAFLTGGLKITVSRRYLKSLEKRLGL